MLDFPNIQTVTHRLGRRLAVWGLGASLLGLALTGQAQGLDPNLPLRNLMVEWRIEGQGRASDSGAGVQQGRVIIDSQRGVIAQGDVRLGTWQTQSHTHSVQQVQVLNGGRARLSVGRSQPYTVWQWAFVPGRPSGPGSRRGGYPPATQAWGQTAWLDLGQGLNVRPSWTGGSAMVTVELEASASGRDGYEPDGQIRRSEVASTLAVPLGEWTVVARSGRTAQQTRSGTLSTEAVDDSQSEQLAIRVTAP